MQVLKVYLPLIKIRNLLSVISIQKTTFKISKPYDIGLTFFFFFYPIGKNKTMGFWLVVCLFKWGNGHCN